jgi:agmatinase
LYGSRDPDIVKHKWSDSLHHISKETTALLGIPSDCGGGILRGANWGPLYIRQARLQKKMITPLLDLGDIRVIPHTLHDRYLNEETLQACRQALYQDPHSSWPVSPLSITEKVTELLYTHAPHLRLFSLGGDHSVSYPLVKSFLMHHRKRGQRVAVIHFDAHTDLLAQRLGFEYCFGTWAYHILPHLQEPSDLIQIGIRSSGKTKQHWESTVGVQQIWAAEIQDHTLQTLCEHLVTSLQKKKIDLLYISFDIDALDSSIASATGTPEPEGLSLYQAKTFIHALKSAFPIQGGDIVEVAPFIHHPELADIKKPQEMTLEAATEILNTLL